MKYYKGSVFFTVNLFLLFCYSPVIAWDLPNPKFIAHISDYLSRYGLIYYFPNGETSRIQNHFKDFQRQANIIYFFICTYISTLKLEVIRMGFFKIRKPYYSISHFSKGDSCQKIEKNRWLQIFQLEQVLLWQEF